jgi:RHS repeat-associated protein
LNESGSDGSTANYQYDANGSLTGKQDASGTSVYSYDGDRRLVDAITPNAGLSYRYDANGIRQSQTVNGVTTRFVVDPTAQYAQVLEERSAAGNVLYLLGDDRIARTQGGTTHYLHTDGLGSTRVLSTSVGQAADRWWYEAFGEVESQTGNSGNAFLFAGEQLDPNLGHYYLRARYMDPSNGRFTQMDAFSGYDTDPVSLHKYLYANGSPVNYRDPSGYMSLPEETEAAQIRNTLAGIQTEVGSNLLNAAMNPAAVSAATIGWAIVANMMPPAINATRSIFSRVKWAYQGAAGRGYVRIIKGAKQHEIDSAVRIAEATGARVLHRGGAKGPDLLIDGALWELKGINSWSKTTLDNTLRDALDNWRVIGRSDNRVFIDGTKIGLTDEMFAAGMQNVRRSRLNEIREIRYIRGDGTIGYWP